MRPVNIEACDGTVQLAVLYAGSAAPLDASCAIVGVVPGLAPYGSKTSARAVSSTISRTFGRIREMVVR